MKERVYGEKVSIDTENTVSFYDQRAKTIKNRKQEYTTVYWAIRTRIFPLSGMRMRSNLSFPS